MAARPPALYRSLALAVVALLVAGGAAAQPAGALRGEVRLLQKKLFGRVEPAEDRSGVLVYVTGFREPNPGGPAQLIQRDEQFRPRVLPVVAGQAVIFPNLDPIYHNVFSVSPVHPFDLGQYKATDPPRAEVFERPGLVPVFCNIHPHMIAYVAVLENHAHALTDAQGRFAIEGVPPGRHTVHAWAPGAERVSREVEVRAGETTRVDFELVAGRIPPHKRKDGSDYPPPGAPPEG